jgi:hypothetical protein
MLRNDASFEQYLEEQQTSLVSLQAILNTLYALALVSLLTGYGIKLYRLWLPLNGSTGDLYRTSYRAVLDRLAGLGLQRQPGESREAFARRLATVTPAFNELTAQHLRRALGSNSGQQENFDWRRKSRQVHTELRNRLPWWRHCLAALNPYSWLMSK